MYKFKPQEIYNYDLNGNRKQAEFKDQKQVYETGEYNRLLSDENYRYNYDHKGNRISKTSKKDGLKTKYSWDNRNRLIKVETSTETIEYIYDYQNRLVKRTDNKNVSIFVHGNWQIILQFNNKNLKPTHRYFWGTRQDELLCDNNNWTLGDHLNTIRDIVKSDGTVEEHLDYNSFGKLISVTKNTDPTFFAYTGKLTDKSSDLQWNINRWYDSNVRRWMSDDPIGFRGHDNNLYRYVSNDFLNNMDQNGLWKYVAGKGKFSGKLGHLPPDDDSGFGKVSSAFSLSFDPDKEKFKNKCCSKVKFIQIYYMDVTYSIPTVFPGLVNRKWTIDAGADIMPYYPNGAFANPRLNSSSMTDSPHFKSLWRYMYGSILVQSFEVCAICSEGHDKNDVYGCLSWYHEFTIQSRIVVSYKRYVNNIIWGEGIPQVNIGTNSDGSNIWLGGVSGLQTYEFLEISPNEPSEIMNDFLGQYL
jgi:RHS repeat-associated protein